MFAGNRVFLCVSKSQHYWQMLDILTKFWVLNDLNAGCNMLFQLFECFLQDFDAKMSKNEAKSVFLGLLHSSTGLGFYSQKKKHFFWGKKMFTVNKRYKKVQKSCKFVKFCNLYVSTISALMFFFSGYIINVLKGTDLFLQITSRHKQFIIYILIEILFAKSNP